MKITKSQLKQIIKEELEKALSERGFGEGEPAKDEWSKKKNVSLEEEDEEDIEERKLTKSEASQKEKLAKKYKPAMKSFKDQYGDEGESIYYATMTKKAKEGEKA